MTMPCLVVWQIPRKRSTCLRVIITNVHYHSITSYDDPFLGSESVVNKYLWKEPTLMSPDFWTERLESRW